MFGKNQKVATPLNWARAAIATLNNGTVHCTVARQRTSVGFKLASGTYVRTYVVTLELVAW